MYLGRLAFFCLLVVSEFFTSPAYAQTDPVEDPGPRLKDDTSGGQFDSIPMTNGNLNLHIPLVSYPQRGKLRLDYSIASTSFVYSEIKNCKTCSYVWSGPVGGLEIADDQAVSGGAILSGPCKDPEYQFYVTTADLSSHYLYLTSGNQRTNCTDTFSYTMETTDGSGFKFVETYGQAAYILDRNGIQYFVGTGQNGGGPASKRIDANGNVISGVFDAGSMTDTIGRVIPPIATTTTNFTGCVGPLPTSSALLWTVPGPSGSPLTFKLCIATVTIQTNFQVPNVTEISGASISVYQCIVLPNGTTWIFEYSSRQAGDPANINYGNLSKITFPSGGSISYSYIMQTAGNVSGSLQEHSVVSARTVNANDGTGAHTWQYTWTPYTENSTSPWFMNSVVVTDPLGNDTVYSDGHEVDGLDHVISKQVFQGLHAAGTLLVTRNTTWSQIGNLTINGLGYTKTASVLPTQKTIVWANGSTNAVQKQYDTEVNGSVSYGIPTSVSEYDFGIGGNSGPLLRQTISTYMALTGPNSASYLANNLLDLPYTVQVQNGAGTQVSLTTYNYDETPLASSGLTSSQQFDSTPVTGSYRGNLTSIYNWLNSGTLNCPSGGSGGSGSNVISKVTYFDAGMLDTSSDPCGHTTTYAYSLNYSAAYPTTVTNALGQQTTKTYELSTGLVASAADLNVLSTTTLVQIRIWILTQKKG
jgi:hypothetical protein